MIEQKPPDHQLQSQEFYFLPPHLTASPLPKYSPITLRQQSFPSFHPLFTALRLCLGLLNLSSLSRLSPISTFPMLSSAIWAPEFPLYLKSLVATFYGYKHVTLQRWGPKLMQLLCPFWNPAKMGQAITYIYLFKALMVHLASYTLNFKELLWRADWLTFYFFVPWAKV